MGFLPSGRIAKQPGQGQILLVAYTREASMRTKVICVALLLGTASVSSGFAGQDRESPSSFILAAMTMKKPVMQSSIAPAGETIINCACTGGKTTSGWCPTDTGNNCDCRNPQNPVITCDGGAPVHYGTHY
jgi:hypothetical protein